VLQRPQGSYLLMNICWSILRLTIGSFRFQANPAYLKDSKIVLPVQVNGKTRGTIQVEETCSEEEAFNLASTDEKLSKYIDGKMIKKKIFVPGKILNVILVPENVKVGQR
jgi:leucyl-tRNA synthetase